MKLAQIEAVTRGVTTALREHLTAELAKRDAEIASLRAALDARPEPKDGDPGKDGEDGADGRGIAAAELKGGDLHLRLTDGTEINVGRVVGEDGKDADAVEIAHKVLALIPTPKDGKDGIASRDELHAEVEARVAAAVDAEVQRRVAEAVEALPVLTYRGIYRQGETYPAGSVVTWGGSAWHANEATDQKPDDGAKSGAWQLMVKKGARGRDAS